MAPRADDADPKRRALLGAALLGWALPEVVPAAHAQAAQPAAPPEGAITVTLLGTGSPLLDPDRFGPSTLVQAGGLNLLFDAGRGCTIRLNQIHVPLGTIDALFLTHYHSDHVNGLPDLWMTSYLNGPFARRTAPFQMHGPTGIARLADTMHAAFGDDIRIRVADEHVSEPGTKVEPHEFSEAGGTVFGRGGVTVTAFAVNHGPLIKPAVGYRIDHAGRSVLISGDTKPEENVIRHGTGVDLLIHEVCAAATQLGGLPEVRAVLDHHTSPEQAGQIFAAAKPRLAAYTHIVRLSRPGVPAVSLPEVEAETRRAYGGPLVIGEDLTRFVVVGDGGGVRVQRWDHARQGYPG